ncbi:unnamed protein product [Clonostachys solani]|uniref:Rhodopsin domain-containing protein n=1 Tax=Clonostachys solani TaxID=160281 RepID=A0A9P0ELN2_9HYPO|nr:unnamed protein product [Clonostachys solani]
MPGPTLPTAEEVAYMQEHADDNIGPNIIACAAVCAVLATFFVGFRLWSRRIANGHLKLETSDWLNLTAWCLYMPYSVLVGMITLYGAGRHAVFVTDARLLQIMTIVDENLYAVILALLKASILSLYRSIFGSHTWFYRLTWVLTAVAIALAIQVILSSNLQCIPLSHTWDPSQHGTCMNYGAEALVAYIINIVTDLVILVMPLPVVLKLKTSKSTRRGLFVVFCAGGSACIVSIVQLRYITNQGSTADASWDNMPSVILADVEIMVGFLATSIAIYRPLYQFVFRGSRLTSSQGYIRQDKSTNPYSYSSSSRRPQHTKRVHTDNRNNGEEGSAEFCHGITVTDQIELATTYEERGSVPQDKW